MEAVEGFGSAVKQAGQSTADKKGMWADSSFEDLVQYNDGFRTQLIGTPEQVAERIIEYRKLGVDLILAGFLHYHEEVERFGRDVLPIVRELEVANGLDPALVPRSGRGAHRRGPRADGGRVGVAEQAPPVISSAREAVATARRYAERISEA